MRHLVVFIAALITIGCSAAGVRGDGGAMMQSEESAGVNAHEASATATVEFLLASAAADFHAHPPAEALRFHDVRIGYLMNPEGSRRYMLCGEFASGQGSGHEDRTSFATIESPGGPNGYQQLLGGNNVCDDPSASFGSAGDLSASLQDRFDSL